jgi:hypothetical protein
MSRSLALMTAIVVGLVVGGCGTASSPSAASSSPTARSTSAAPPSTDAVIAHLKKAGVPIGEVQTYDASTDGNHLLGRPGQYIAKASWHDSRLDADADFNVPGGGTVEVFDSATALQMRQQYVEALTQGNALLAQYIYGSGLALIRVSSLLTPDQAKQYQQALMSL